jgi:outer membrane biosynthesis protein TonB
MLVVFVVFRSATQPARPLEHFLPVDLVQLARQTTSPPQPQKTAVPRQLALRAAREAPSSPHPPVSLAPSRKLPPDTLEIRLRKLAKLRQPDAVLPVISNTAESNEAATSDDASQGADAAYRVRDFIRAQVERRWSLDLKRAHNVVVLLHVVVARDGTVDRAEIVDRARYASDAAWRNLALSARNAVLLSSPLALPVSQTRGRIDVTLALNPRDVLR